MAVAHAHLELAAVEREPVVEIAKRHGTRNDELRALTRDLGPWVEDLRDSGASAKKARFWLRPPWWITKRPASDRKFEQLWRFPRQG